MKTIRALLAVLLLAGALGLNGTSVRADDNSTTDPRPVGINPSDDV